MRLVVILWRLGPIALAFWRDHRRWLFFGAPARRTAADHERRAFRLVASLAALGPTFVKMAQLFAGRTDLLAPAYARALTTLTDQVPQVPLAAIGTSSKRSNSSEGDAPYSSRMTRSISASGTCGTWSVSVVNARA